MMERTMNPENVLTQRDWSEEELLENGFRYYQRIKRVVLARELPQEEAPLKMRYHYDELIATAGYMICFAADWRKKKTLYEYYHWPVAPDHFSSLYADWDDPRWKPRRGEKHLLLLGCCPYYNAVGVWAKVLQQPQMILGTEHRDPFEVPAGAWLMLAAKGAAMGAPYWNFDKAFRQRFIVE